MSARSIGSSLVRNLQGDLAASAAIGLFMGSALAEPKAPAAAPPAAPACKAYNSGPCCDPAIAAHLTKKAIFTSCRQSDATFLGEQGSKESCKYFFQVKDQKVDGTFVQVYAPAMKMVQKKPNDPFFQWKKVGKVFYMEKALSPKAAPMMVNSTGLWLSGKGYMMSVNATTKVCTKPQAKKLATKMK